MDNGIRSVLVHLDGPQRAAERLQVARRVALEHGARVCAMHVSAPLPAVIPLESDPGGYLAELLLELDDERRAGSRAAFDAVLGSAGGVPSQFVALAPIEPARRFARQAMYADLLVLGQDDPDQAGNAGTQADFPERALAGSGRPAIVVPYAGDFDAGFTNVVIAWKETPEAARAVAAAMPLLRKAANVHVVAWGEPADAVEGGLDLAAYLLQHGIDAHFHACGPEPAGEVGELLLSRVADLSGHLLVMGCYGHGRTREWVLGGASRTVLRSMTVPVLMAH